VTRAPPLQHVHRPPSAGRRHGGHPAGAEVDIDHPPAVAAAASADRRRRGVDVGHALIQARGQALGDGLLAAPGPEIHLPPAVRAGLAERAGLGRGEKAPDDERIDRYGPAQFVVHADGPSSHGHQHQWAGVADAGEQPAGIVVPRRPGGGQGDRLRVRPLRQLGSENRSKGPSAHYEPAPVSGRLVTSGAAALVAGKDGPFGHRFEKVLVRDGEMPYLHLPGGEWRR